MGIRFQLRPNEMQAIERAETARLLEQADDFFSRKKPRTDIDDYIPRWKPRDDA